jgi:hypothetical protein
MTAHIAFSDPEALFKELGEALWGLGIHAKCGQLHTETRDIDGLDHDLRCLRDCLTRAIALHAELRREG